MAYYTDHFLYRADQRNFTPDEIEFVIEHGKRVHRAGVIFCQMLEKWMPDDLPGNHPYRRLKGSTVVLCRCGQLVITAYKDDKAYKKDRRKPKFSNNGKYCCPCERRDHPVA